MQRPSQKLCPRYFGPYKILDKIGAVAYKLDLPAETKIHHTFHVSQLKAYNGGDPTFTTIPSHLFDEVVPLKPEAILDRSTIKRRNQAATQVLIKWKDHPVEDATWEFWFDIQNKFPQFNP